MKKIVFALLMTMGMLNAQNNLVFNRVLNFNLGFGQNVTVPEGKVWKVEEFYNTGNSANALYFSNPIPEVGNPVNNSFYQFNDRPVWFEEGVVLEGNGQVISVLEFNVVPTSTGTGSGTSGGGVSSDGLVFEEVLSLSLNVTSVPSSGVRFFGEINVPEGKIFKIINVSCYLDYGNGNTSVENSGNVYIGEELFQPHLNNSININRFLPSGSYQVRTVVSEALNKVVINAIQYSAP